VSHYRYIDAIEGYGKALLFVQRKMVR